VSRLPRELAVVPALLVARTFPDSGLGLYLKLAAATLAVLLPGSLVARALRRPSVSATLAWTLACLFASGAVVFAVHGTLGLAIGLVAAIGACALAVVAASPQRVPRRRPAGAIGLGAVLGILVWQAAGTLDGDALFHLARVRKLEAFGDLHLRTVDEFRDGGLHPGYAFPLWHLLLAFVARLASVDPGRVLAHESALLVPLALAVAYEAGVAVFRRRGAAVAVAAASAALFAVAPGHGGSYVSLDLPATAARQLLVPAAMALFFSLAERPSLTGAATLAASGLGLALVHPTYAFFVACPLAGYVAARWLLARSELRAGLAGLAALLVPALAVSAWLLPILRETRSHNPSDAELARSLAQYRQQLVVYSLHSYRLSAVVFARTGAVAVAALAAVPFALVARRRRWAALVLGGTLVVSALMLVPPFFTTLSDAVSLSQARRAVGFLPLPFAFAGGALLLARVLGQGALAVALAAGIALQLAYPGDFVGYRITSGGPAAIAWFAAGGAAIALALGAVLRAPAPGRRGGGLAALAALLFLVPVAVSGFSHWGATPFRGHALTPGLVRALREHVPAGAVVFSDDSTDYRIAAAAPVYVNAAPPGHVADTKANRRFARRRDANRFLATGDLAIPRRYGAGWIVIDRLRPGRRPALALPIVYRDADYVLYRLPRRQSR